MSDIKRIFFENLCLFVLTAMAMACIIYLGNKFIDNFMEPFYICSQFVPYIENSYSPLTPAYKSSRFLTPLLVYLLPFDHLTGFKVVNLTGLFATSILFYYYLKKLGFGSNISLVGILFFLLSPITVYTIGTLSSPDPLTFFFLILSFIAILYENDKLYFFALATGILNKEVIVLSIPFYFLNKLKTSNKLYNALKSTFKVTAPAIVLFISIKLYFNLSNIHYFSLTAISGVLEYYLNYSQQYGLPSYVGIGYRFYLPFGMLWIISLLNVKHVNKFLRNSLIILPFVFMLILIACDMERMLFLLFPVVIPIALFEFKKGSNIYILSIICILSAFIFFVRYQIDHWSCAFPYLLLEILIIILIIISVFIRNPIFNKGSWLKKKWGCTEWK